MILYNGIEVMAVDGDLDWQLSKRQRLLDTGHGIGIVVNCSALESFIPCPQLSPYPYDVTKAMSDLLDEIQIETDKFNPDSPEDLEDDFIPSLKRITNQDQVLANFNAKAIKEDIFQNITVDESHSFGNVILLLQEFILMNAGSLPVDFKRVMHQAGVYSLFNSMTGIVDPKIGMSMCDMVQRLQRIFDAHSFKRAYSLVTDDECVKLVAHILDDLVKAFFPSLHYHPDHHDKRRRFIAVQLVEAKYACNFQSITGTILERLTYFPDQPIRSIINFDSDSSYIQEFIQVLSKITGFHFEGSWNTLKVHVLTMDDPDGTIASHAAMHKDGFVKLHTILELFGKYLLSFCDAVSIPPRLRSLDAVAEKITEIESRHLNLDEERVQMTEAFQCITKSGKDSGDYVRPSSEDLGSGAEMQLTNLMNGQAIDIRTQRSIGDISENECIMLEQCTVDAIKQNNPDYYKETFGGVGSREIKVGGITLIVGKNGQCFLIFPSFFLSYAPPNAKIKFEVRFSVAKSFIELATLLNKSGHLDDGKFLDLKRRMQCYLMEVRGLNGTISEPKGDLQSAIHNALPKGLVTHKSTNILPISKKLNVSVWACLYFRVTLGEETFGKLVTAMSGNSAIRLIENSKNKQCSAVPDWIAKNRQNRQQPCKPYEDKWNAMYDELKIYILEHEGDPPRSLKVGAWMNTQRKQHKNKANGKTPALSDERERKLNELEGFEWVGSKANRPTK